MELSSAPAARGIAPQGAISLLVVEDNPRDRAHLEQAFQRAFDQKLQLMHAATLSQAIEALDDRRFDLVVLDLGLPDSQGLETFARLHTSAPSVPVLVLTSSAEEEELGRSAVEHGAQDYLAKSDVEPPWLVRAIRYALERARLQREVREIRERERREEEIAGVERLSRPPGTSISASLYSAGPLRNTAPAEFSSTVEDYAAILERALEHRFHKETVGWSEALRDLSDKLGYLRAGPRDAIEVHTRAVRALVANATAARANAYVEESRLVLLELMGNLVSHYRTQCTPSRARRRNV